MPGARARKDLVAIGFMIVWMVVWGAGMLVAVWLMGGRVLAGEAVAALVLLVWLAAAGFGLLSAGRRLVALVMREPRARRRGFGEHRWSDGVSDRQDP
jgi:hypothetical protein